MKKLKVSLLIIFIICLFNFTKVLAADASVALNIDKTRLKPGDTVTATLNASCEEGLSFIGTKIEYDTNALTLQSKTIANDWVNYGTDKLELFINSSNKTTNATICTLVFKVNDNATEETTTIAATEIEITDINNNEYTKPKSEKILTIAKEESNPEGENEQPGNTENEEKPTEEDENQVKDEEKQKEGQNQNETEDKGKKAGEENKTQDKNTSKNKLPNTGRTNIIMGIALLSTITITTVAYIKYKKYKNI